MKRAKDVGLSVATIDRAAVRLGVIKKQVGYGSAKRSEWSLRSNPLNPISPSGYEKIEGIEGIEAADRAFEVPI